MGIVNLFGCKAGGMTAETGTRDIMYIELLSGSKSAFNILDSNFIAGPIQNRTDGFAVVLQVLLWWSVGSHLCKVIHKFCGLSMIL